MKFLRPFLFVALIVFLFPVVEASYDEPPDKDLTLVEPTDGETFTGTIPVEVSVDGTTVGEGFDHLHVYVDGTLWNMIYTTSFEITDLDEGEHAITVTLANNNHTDYTEEDLTATFTVTFHKETTFPDVNAANVYYPAIEYLVSTGTLEGYDDGTFKPLTNINRAEMVKILVASQEIDPDAATYQNCFPDVGTDWYARYVCYAYEEGWVSGYPDNLFRPGDLVNKVEAVKMVIHAFQFEDELPESVDENVFDDTPSSAWYSPYLYLAKAMGLLEETSGDYAPDDEMGRGSVAEIVFRAWVTRSMHADAYDTDLRDSFFAEEEFSL